VLRISIVLALLSSLLVACGGKSTTTPARPSSPFTEQDLKLFDDGVDLVADPDGLAGRWADDWNLEMRERVERSDLIALLEVSTLLTDTDPEGHTTHRLVVKLDKILKGQPPSMELNLSSADGAVGFPTVDSNKGRLLHMNLLLLLKWVEQPDGGVSSHFHLASSSDKVVSRVVAHIARDKPQERTVIERRYDSSKGEQAPADSAPLTTP